MTTELSDRDKKKLSEYDNTTILDIKQAHCSYGIHIKLPDMDPSVKPKIIILDILNLYRAGVKPMCAQRDKYQNAVYDKAIGDGTTTEFRGMCCWMCLYIPALINRFKSNRYILIDAIIKLPHKVYSTSNSCNDTFKGNHDFMNTKNACDDSHYLHASFSVIQSYIKSRSDINADVRYSMCIPEFMYDMKNSNIEKQMIKDSSRYDDLIAIKKAIYYRSYDETCHVIACDKQESNGIPGDLLIQKYHFNDDKTEKEMRMGTLHFNVKEIMFHFYETHIRIITHTPGTFWGTQRDISRYRSLIKRPCQFYPCGKGILSYISEQCTNPFFVHLGGKGQRIRVGDHGSLIISTDVLQNVSELQARGNSEKEYFHQLRVHLDMREDIFPELTVDTNKRRTISNEQNEPFRGHSKKEYHKEYVAMFTYCIKNFEDIRHRLETPMITHDDTLFAISFSKFYTALGNYMLMYEKTGLV